MADLRICVQPRTTANNPVQGRTTANNINQHNTTMHNCTQLLNQVCDVSYIEADKLHNLTYIHGVGVMLNMWRDFKPLPMVGLGSCEITAKHEGRKKLYTTKVSAFLSEHFDPRDRRLCYQVTCVNGERYLVGNSEHPYPITNVQDTMPDKESDKCGCQLTVEYTDTIGYLPILD